MADYVTIDLIEEDCGIATLTLNRPEKHNALNAQLISELTEVARQIAKSQTIRAVILAAKGKTFCAGGDLNWMREQRDKTDEERVEEGLKLANMLTALDDLPKPLIAKVHGNAFGGGVGLLCVCDIVLMADHIQWGLSETRLGLIPATIGPFVVRRLGEGAARRVFMNSKLFDAAEARRLGLASESVSIDALDGAVMTEARAFLSCAPGAVADAKALVKHLARTHGDPIAHTTKCLAARWADPESEEGIGAFFEKRKATWVIE